MTPIAHFRLVSDNQLAALHESPDTLGPFLFGDDDEPTIAFHASHDLDLGKAWAAVALLLGPLRFMKEGGRTFTGTEVVARSFTGDQVNELGKAIAVLDQKRLKARFDPTMGAFDALYAEFVRLQQFFAGAQKRKLAMIVYFA